MTMRELKIPLSNNIYVAITFDYDAPLDNPYRMEVLENGFKLLGSSHLPLSAVEKIHKILSYHEEE